VTPLPQKKWRSVHSLSRFLRIERSMSAVVREVPVDSPLCRAQDGEPDAFAELVAAHEAMVFSIAFHCTNDRSRAEELAQDVFLELYRHLGDLVSEAHLVGWLRQVTSRRCIDLARRPWWRRSISIDTIAEPRVEARLADPFRDRRLRALIAELPPHQRLVVTLRYQEELTPNEIGEVAGLPVNTVKSHLHRALLALRKGFGEPS
jgi:RNA polymerase sigma-70 factor (ECF subfamily)